MRIHVGQELLVDSLPVGGIPIRAAAAVSTLEQIQIAVAEVVANAWFSEVEGTSGVADQRR